MGKKVRMTVVCIFLFFSLLFLFSLFFCIIPFSSLSSHPPFPHYRIWSSAILSDPIPSHLTPSHSFPLLLFPFLFFLSFLLHSFHSPSFPSVPLSVFFPFHPFSSLFSVLFFLFLFPAVHFPFQSFVSFFISSLYFFPLPSLFFTCLSFLFSHKSFSLLFLNSFFPTKQERVFSVFFCFFFCCLIHPLDWSCEHASVRRKSIESWSSNYRYVLHTKMLIFSENRVVGRLL